MARLTPPAVVRDVRAKFDKAKTDVLAFNRTLALSWAVPIDHNYSYTRRGLGLKPELP